MRYVLLMTALCMFLAGTSYGHGGQYRGPSDIVVPGSGGGDIPPANVGGPNTVGPVGPTTVSPKGPAFTNTGGLPGKNARPSSDCTPKKRSNSRGYERWEFWWEQNKEAFLDLKNRLDGSAVISGSSSILTGRGKRVYLLPSKRPTATVIRVTIVPSLMRALKEDNADIQDSVVLALARMTHEDDADLIFEEVLSLVGSKHKTARESATLSLGVLGSDRATEPLYQLMINSDTGQALTGRHEVPVLVRAFAALSLGLINSPDSVDHLITVVKRAPEKDRDLRACAITALGLMKDNERSEEIVNFLIKLMTDDKMDPVVRAGIPVALAKLGDPLALSSVIRAFGRSRQDSLLLMSCAMAMGQLATMEDKEVVHLLKSYIDHGKDAQTRHFAYMALAQIAAGDPNPEDHAAAQEKTAVFFLKEIMRPSKQTHLPWAVLAAAIHAQKQERFAPMVIEKVSEAYRKSRNPSYRGAMAIALGLLNAKAHSQALLDEMLQSKDDSLKGYLCVALGLMNERIAADAIRKIAATEIKSFRLRLQAATALGLLADSEAVEVLIKALKEGQTISVISSAAKALGLMGDAKAITPLLEILDDKKVNDLARAFAAVALGILGERTDLPWYTVITENNNYRAKVEATSEVYSLL